MPDDARERLRRAQHPGHRRQAHPAHPQRHEHRRRRGRQRSSHRRARRAVQHRRRPGLPGRAAGGRRRASSTACATSASRRSATCSPPSRRRSCSASGPTTPSSPSPPTAPRLYGSERAQDARPVASAVRSVTSKPPRSFAEHLASVGTDHMVECTERTATASSTSATTRGSSSRARRSRCSRPGDRSTFWRELRRLTAVWDEMIVEFNASARGRSPTRDHRLPLCGVRRRGRRSATPLAVAVSRTPPRPTAITCCSASGRRAPVRFGDDPNPLVAFDSLYAWAAFAEAHGMDADDRAAGPLPRRGRHGRRRRRLRGTPFARSRPLCEALGFSRDGGVLVKDETGNVAGSHKARHLAAHPAAPAGRRAARRGARRRATPAGDRLLRQRRAGRGHAGERPRRGRCEVFVPTWADGARRGSPPRAGGAGHGLPPGGRRSARRPVCAPVPRSRRRRRRPVRRAGPGERAVPRHRAVRSAWR